MLQNCFTKQVLQENVLCQETMVMLQVIQVLEKI